MDKRLDCLFKKHPASQKIAAVPEVGVLTATALLAAVSSPQVFQNRRHMAAWLVLFQISIQAEEKRNQGDSRKEEIVFFEHY